MAFLTASMSSSNPFQNEASSSCCVCLYLSIHTSRNLSSFPPSTFLNDVAAFLRYPIKGHAFASSPTSLAVNDISPVRLSTPYLGLFKIRGHAYFDTPPYLLIGLSDRHIVNNGRANLLFDTPTTRFLFEQQWCQFLQATAPGEELMACVGRDVAYGIQTSGFESFDAFVDAAGILA